MIRMADTLELMYSSDYKKRFFAEYWQTKLRAEKLKCDIEDWKDGLCKDPPTCPIELLERQLKAMEEYLDALRERSVIEEVDLSDKG